MGASDARDDVSSTYGAINIRPYPYAPDDECRLSTNRSSSSATSPSLALPLLIGEVSAGNADEAQSSVMAMEGRPPMRDLVDVDQRDRPAAGRRIQESLRESRSFR
jgi:hypothetical protein